ncbi:MAG: formylglycine-generating enzyme family protein [Candidatus Poribacteria bacterium]|nr:formylglycine-generating enzyme family protein [Candidatus Poribacteria bacterium]
MSKRDEFITIIQAVRNASPTISNEQRKGFLRQAVQQHDLTVEEAADILDESGLVIGEQIDYFEVLGLSAPEFENQSESVIANRVETAHKKLYSESLRAGGRPRADGKTEEQWRTILNQARDALIDPQKRHAHFEVYQYGEESVETPSAPLYLQKVNLDNMELIPAGEFEMGSHDGELFSYEHPIHKVFVDAFYIDKYPVTNAQYKEFVEANPRWRKTQGIARILSSSHLDSYYLHHWYGNDFPEGKDDHPVVHISWYAAMAYSQWVGKRLPTEAEWEKAARGGLTDQKYPWGDVVDIGKANYGKNIGSTTPVEFYPANGYDLYDMVGNVWEWCLDEYGFYGSFPHRNLLSEEDIKSVTNHFKKVKSFRVLRGGSWITTVQDLGISNRCSNHPRFTNPESGFRCVKSLYP